MSIHKNRYGTWEARWRENGRQKSASRKTKKEAQQAELEATRRTAQFKPTVRPKDAPTLEEFAAEWMATRADLEESTQRKYMEFLRVHILPELGHLSLVELRPRRLAEWQVKRLAEGAGPAVLGKAQTLLGGILQKAVLPYEYLDTNPILALDRPAYKKREHRWLTAVEVETLRSWFIAEEDLGSATLISVLGYIGIRPQDALGLEWADVGERLRIVRKNSEGTILPGSKTGQHHKRRVYLPAPVAADLAEWQEVSKGTGLIFPRAKDGEPWNRQDYANWRSRIRADGSRGRSFKAAAEAVGLGSSLKPYDLRHTAASLYAATGWGAVEIAEQLGHSPTESQRTYQHILLPDGAAPRKSIEDYIREARGLAVAAKPAKMTADKNAPATGLSVREPSQRIEL